MIVFKKYIYLHLQKTAGTFITNFLINHKNAVKVHMRHSSYKHIGSPKGKIIWGGIRNPWDWYVSWYASNTTSVGTTFPGIFSEGMDFKEFMKKIFFGIKSGKHGRDLYFDKISKANVGVYTYRYIDRFGKDINTLPLSKSYFLKNHDNIIMVPHRNIYRFENLSEDIKRIMANELTVEDIQKLDSLAKVNTSRHKDYKEYYDDEMIEWVKEKDQLIIEKFSYKFE